MKKILFVLAIALIGTFATTAAKAQVGVDFQNLTLAQALEKGAQESKPVYVIVSASWCGPCKYMASSVFPSKDAGAFFNKNFVNVKFDGEKGEGVDVASKYGVSGYPTAFVLNSAGKILFKVAGSAPTAEYIAKIKEEATKAGVALK